MNASISFASSKTRYYKIKEARAVLDHAHAQRNGFTKSENVNTSEIGNNCGFYFHNAKSCSHALDLMIDKHKLVTGKKIRKDNNILFEHVIWLSEKRYAWLEEKYGNERVKQEFLKRLKVYAESIKNEFGFEPLGIDVHFDEGHYRDGKFIRNTHAHIQFINFDFSKKVAPLRHLMKKGKNTNLQTNSLNPNFEKIQDLTYEAFKSLGFKRGLSKNITGSEHLNKEEFVRSKLDALANEISSNEIHNMSLKNQIDSQSKKLSKMDEEIEYKKREIFKLSQTLNDLYTAATDLKKAITNKARDAIRSISSKLERSSAFNININRR